MVSVHSSSLNLSRGGTLRLNLNQVVSDVSPTATNYSELVRTQLNRITAAITNTRTNAGPSNTAAMPLFGQRLYRISESASALNGLQVSGQSSGNNLTDIYLQKVAANLRDYIDPDSIPTVIRNNSGFLVNSGNNTIPWNAFQGAGQNEVAAIGKEPLPLLTEFAVVLRYVTQPGNNFNFNLSFYFEFWNPTGNSVSLADLGNPTLTIGNLYDFEVVNGGAIDSNVLVGSQTRSRPLTRIDLPLSSFGNLASFPPNTFTVVTTDIGGWPFGYGAPSNLFRNTNSLVTYSGNRTSPNNPVRARFVGGRATSPGGRNDYDLWMWLAGNRGVVESFSGLVTVGDTGYAL